MLGPLNLFLKLIGICGLLAGQLRKRGSIPEGRKARDFSVLKSIRARSSEHPASYSTPTEVFSSELRRPEREAYYSLVVPRLRINGATPITPLSLSRSK